MSYIVKNMKSDIASMIKLSMYVLAGAFQDKYKQPKFEDNLPGESDFLVLYDMIDAGEINQAENVLLSILEQSEDKKNINNKIEDALRIYQYMNEFDDKYLEDHNYSRNEIAEGVKRVLDFSSVSLPMSIYFD